MGGLAFVASPLNGLTDGRVGQVGRTDGQTDGRTDGPCDADDSLFPLPPRLILFAYFVFPLTRVFFLFLSPYLFVVGIGKAGEM